MAQNLHLSGSANRRVARADSGLGGTLAEMLENEVTTMGSEAVIPEAIALTRAQEDQEDKVLARFKADRDEQCRKFIGRCADFEAEIANKRAINKFICAEREKDGTDLKRLQSWLDKIREFNFYGVTQSE